MYIYKKKNNNKTTDKSICTFGDDMIRGDKIREFKSSTKPSNPNMIKELLAGINNAIPLLKGIEIVYTGFGGGIFLLPSKSMKLTRPEKSK